MIEGEIIHEQRDRVRLRQRPDRIIGLKETENISCLLDQTAHPLVDDQANNLRNIVRTTPSKNTPKQQSKALILPFLVIEAKSHKAQESFSDTQTQTALPIRALLNLQRNLWRHASSQSAKPEPLVWFLGYRGSDWKMYACYRSEEGTLSTSYVSRNEIT